MKNIKFQNLNISSFDRRYSANINFFRPEKYKDLENSSRENKNLITMGLNYSYSPVFFYKKSISIDFSKFDKILNFNKKKKEITVEAGIKISDLMNFLLKQKMWLPQLPGYPFITIGGAIAANVHGKSSGAEGTIKNSVKEILLFHKDNGWKKLNNNKNKELFDLTIGGLGLTGTIVNVTLKLKNFSYSRFITKRFKVKNIWETIKYLNKYKKFKNLLVYSWNDASGINNFGRGYVYVSKPKLINNKNIINLNFKNYKYFFLPLWNRITSKIFNYFFFQIQKLKKKEFEESFERAIFPFLGNENYFNFFGKKGFIESQLIVPLKVIEDFFKEFMKFYIKLKPEIILFSFKNISGKKKYIRFEGEGICITFDYINNKRNLLFLKKIDSLCIKYKIIPSIIKDSRIKNFFLDKCVLDAGKFRKDLLKFDKKRIYQSETSIRLKL